MKKLAIVLFCLALVFAFSTQVVAKNDKPDCTTIKDGTLEYATATGYSSHYFGDLPLEPGFDAFGHNYQAHMFNGSYANPYLSRDGFPPYEGDDEAYLEEYPDAENHWAWPYRDVDLLMKWNDAWISNKDCDGDGLLVLDRHYGFDSYIGSGAWLTNHQWGSYLRNWDLTGDWVLEFDYLGASYVHDMVLVGNTFTGTGGYPAGSQSYSVTWTVAGIIDGDNIDMRIEYDGSTYYVDVVGTIAQDGTMSGTWDNLSQEGVWESTSGAGTGETCKWNYFTKIVAAPADATMSNGTWFAADGTEIGPEIWGEFATIQSVYNDPCGGATGLEYLSPSGPGFGKFQP